ncbi:hypothetical protein [Acidovorax cavernicola]|uniref:Uncharacterized protein n=1 Tax=Acidovorax cavernicola TaxID=1675792 RepID=A0A9X8GUS5_9BURK|nr:hypothetical protein [Acidovorax cavernicola]RIX77897.1 hypothetical protein D3H34_17650 [Acidovorax cavernicola]
MTATPLILYYDMSEKLSDHLRATRAYPEKFVLSPLLHEDYLRDVALLSHTLEKDLDPATHMGVPIEISDGSPGVMVASDGTEVWLL